MSDKLKDHAYVEVTFDPEPDQDLNFDGMKGHHELGRPFFFEISLTSDKIVGDVSKLVGTSCTVWMAQSAPRAATTARGAGEDRYINGVVTRVVSEGLARGAYHYHVEIRPAVWLLSQITECRIFQNKTAFEIVTDEILKKAEFIHYEDKRQASSGNIQLEYCVQYHETSLDFITRLMEEFGFYFFFKHEDKKHTLVFADDPNAHTLLTDVIPYQFDQTEQRVVDDHFWEWASEMALHSGQFTFQDYNFTTPSVDLTAKTVKAATHQQYNNLEVYEYPGRYETTGDGQTLTDVRMQAIVAQRVVFRGDSNSRKLLAGWRFKLDQYPDAELNKEYLIMRSDTSMSISEGLSTDQDGGETLDSYRVVVHAIRSDVPFRLRRMTKRPIIRGPQTAKVVGPSGDEIYTDEYGRVKVKFHWDRSEVEDDQRTCWIRVAQTWAGASWGSIFIPRVGMEVVVEFLEGNPDRPLITGVVYNATQTVPYALPDNKTRSTFKSNSSTGGSGYNELRFEDKAGSEEVYFQAQKDYTKKVLNNETVTIHVDTSTTVETGNRTMTVSQGNDKKTVSTGNLSTDVSAGGAKHTTGLAFEVTANTSVKLTGTASIELTCGGSSIKLDPSGITISGPMITLSGSASISMSAGMISIN